AVAHEVDAGPAAQVERGVGALGNLPRLGFASLVQARTDVLGVVGQVLGVVVGPAVLGHDVDRGQGDAVEHADGVLATAALVAFDQLLDQQFARVGGGQRDRLVQAGFVINAADADARTFARRLDDHRQAQLAGGGMHVAAA